MLLQVALRIHSQMMRKTKSSASLRWFSMNGNVPMPKKWHHKLLKSASGVLRGQESPSQCVNEPGGAEAEDGDGLLDSLDEGLFSTSSVSSPLKSQPPSNPASSLTNSLILAMTLILIMHAMIANL